MRVRHVKHFSMLSLMFLTTGAAMLAWSLAVPFPYTSRRLLFACLMLCTAGAAAARLTNANSFWVSYLIGSIWGAVSVASIVVPSAVSTVLEGDLLYHEDGPTYILMLHAFMVIALIGFNWLIGFGVGLVFLVAGLHLGTENERTLESALFCNMRMFSIASKRENHGENE